MSEQSTEGLAAWTAFKNICDLLAIGEHTQLLSLESWNWELIVEIASKHFVSPALAHPLNNQRNAPQDAKDYFNAILELNRARNEIQIEGLKTIATKLQAQHINPLFLKGAASIISGTYPDPAARFMGDIDILISPAQRSKIKQIFSENEFIDRPGDTDRQASIFYHEETMVHKETDLGFDIHIALGRNRYLSMLDSKGFLERSVIVEFAGTKFLIPCATDRVIHCIVHARIQNLAHSQGTVDLRQLLELKSIILKNNKDLDWQAIQVHFEKNGKLEVLASQFFLMKELLNLETPLKLAGKINEIDRLKFWVDPTKRKSALMLIAKTIQNYARVVWHEPWFFREVVNPTAWRNQFKLFQKRLKSGK
jgi:Uncharacterised nucleotidyltransferase